MNNKQKFSRYNDGVISIYRENEPESNFSKKRNESVMDNMTFIVKLDYEESSKREQDLQFAEQFDFTLSLKVRTRFVKDVDNKCKAVINGYLYDIKSVDTNRSEMWLYMEGVGAI